jgi:hypothetical protein
MNMDVDTDMDTGTDMNMGTDIEFYARTIADDFSHLHLKEIFFLVAVVSSEHT